MIIMYLFKTFNFPKLKLNELTLILNNLFNNTKSLRNRIVFKELSELKNQ